MIEVTVKQLPYSPDSSAFFNLLLNYPWPIFLDSGKTMGRYDILTAKPWATLCTWETHSQITLPQISYQSNDDPFSLIHSVMQQCPFKQQSIADLPFVGGAMGYFAYDLARRIELLPNIAAIDIDMPVLALGFYAWAIIVDHQLETTYLVAHLYNDAIRAFIQNLLPQLVIPLHQQDKKSHLIISSIQPEMNKSDYFAAIARIKMYLLAGDCYQVNFAQRFHAKVSGCSWSLYQTLRQNDVSPFAAYMRAPGFDILSFSPERFLHINNDKVTTQPIKGTRPRDISQDRDQQLAQELAVSAKDRAENLMIVDLMRNDLSKNCYPGSVQVPELCELYTFSHVHHLISTITGYLSTNAIDLLKGCFPGGSVTGAPKIRAMQIIEELEPVRRGLYCGSIGYISVDGHMDTNIAIRSLIYQKDHLFCYAGGGIVADSIAEQEYQESLDKISWILEAINSCTK